MIKWILLTILVFLGSLLYIVFTECMADEIYTYDENGLWNGSIDEYGNQYDRDGQYKGIVDVMGNIRNRDGIWQGYIEFDRDKMPRPIYIIPNE